MFAKFVRWPGEWPLGRHARLTLGSQIGEVHNGMGNAQKFAEGQKASREAIRALAIGKFGEARLSIARDH